MQYSSFLLSQINSPGDLKKLNLRSLNQLAGEIRDEIVRTVAHNGGHLASNLGVVELSIALHRVFNSPNDKIVWDVGHQCYAHKLLTGRFGNFASLRMSGGLSGFPKRSESPHDAFNTGHASTSISAALGLLAAERLLGGKGSAVAVIGDGALTGGLAYEALSHAGHLGLPLIVILNDNKMSISPNVGGISKYLSRLSMKAKYQTFRRHFDAMAKRIPFFGDIFFEFVIRLKRAVKAVFYTDNFFVDLGFEYVGPIGGHNIETLTNVLEDVRQLDRPVVIHMITRKGKGYSLAEDDPGNYHGVGSFSVDNGLTPRPAGNSQAETGGQIYAKKTFTECFSTAMLEAAHRDKHLIAITAAMQTGTGLSLFRKFYPDRFYDVGIAEEHAVVFAAGLAARGLKPVVAIYSTFIQRAVDQIIHDTALQKLPVIFALDRSGFVSDDGETHQGIFDIALFRSVPNMAILAPASEAELRLMLDWTLNREQLTGPVIIRYPKAFCPEEIPAFSQQMEAGRGVWLTKSGKCEVCIAFTGSLYSEVRQAADILKERGIEAGLYNLRFLKPVDENHLAALIKSHKLTVFAEEGIQNGGFGEYAAACAGKFMQEGGFTAAETGNIHAVQALAVESGFSEDGMALGTREELLALNKMDGKNMAQRIICRYKELMNNA